MLTPSTPFDVTWLTVRWIVSAPRRSAEHMLGVPLVESIMMMVSTTLVPCAWAAWMNPGTGPFGLFHVDRPESSLKSPVQLTWTPK